MYAPNTILVKNDQKPPDEETGEEYPYNRVRVIGESPVAHTAGKDNWTGEDAKGVLIEALTNFGATSDQPFGKLRQLFTVESVPEPEVEIERVKIRPSVNAGPTPEDIFKQQAPGEAPEEGQVRGRTPYVDPLADEEVIPQGGKDPID